jgi:hypothetical protein
MLCSANERYELLAQEIKRVWQHTAGDASARTRSTFPAGQDFIASARAREDLLAAADRKGSARPDGSLCQDITALTFSDESFDLIVSSDVLSTSRRSNERSANRGGCSNPGRLICSPCRPGRKPDVGRQSSRGR